MREVVWVVAAIAVTGCIQVADLPEASRSEGKGGAGGGGGSLAEPGECESALSVPAEILVDFGVVPVGTIAPGHVELRNLRDEPMIVAMDELEPPFAVQDALIEVPADGLQRISFTFAPEEEGYFEAEAYWSDGCRRGLFLLAGQGVVPQFTCVPDELDFGYVAVGMPATAELVCSNETPLELTLDLAPLSGDDASMFELPPENRVRIPAGATTRIPITFLPARHGEAFAYFAVSSETQAQNVQLVGSGVDEGPAD